MFYFILGLVLSLLVFLGLKYRSHLVNQISDLTAGEELALDRVEQIEHTVIVQEMERREDEKNAPVGSAGAVLTRLQNTFSKNRGKETSPVPGVGLPTDPK